MFFAKICIVQLQLIINNNTFQFSDRPSSFKIIVIYFNLHVVCKQMSKYIYIKLFFLCVIFTKFWVLVLAKQNWFLKIFQTILNNIVTEVLVRSSVKTFSIGIYKIQIIYCDSLKYKIRSTWVSLKDNKNMHRDMIKVRNFDYVLTRVQTRQCQYSLAHADL